MYQNINELTVRPCSEFLKHVPSACNVSFRNNKFECGLNLCLYNVDVTGHVIKNDLVLHQQTLNAPP